MTSSWILSFLCVVCRRLFAVTLWTRQTQSMIWQNLTSQCPPHLPRHHASDRPVSTHWSTHNPRGSSHAGATAGATVRPPGNRSYLSDQSVDRSHSQTVRKGPSAPRVCPAWKHPVVSLTLYQLPSAAPEQRAPALASTPVTSRTMQMRRSAALPALFKVTHAHNFPPTPPTKPDTLPPDPRSTGAASANRCRLCRAGTGSRGWARRRGRSPSPWRPSIWTAALTWGGGLCHLTLQVSLLIHQRAAQ